MAYLLRLDDAASKMNIKNWLRMEQLLKRFNIHPLIGVIPDIQDQQMSQYATDNNFWDRVREWDKSGWAEIALHGYQHVCTTKCGGINPVNYRSEFAGVPYDKQAFMLYHGYNIMCSEGVVPRVFFAPSHTFDKNTLLALKNNTPIRIVSDTIAYDTYNKYGITFIPQQSGHCRYLPLKAVTFCYHPNFMKDFEYNQLELFLKKYHSSFVPIQKLIKERNYGLIDSSLKKLYFLIRKTKK